MTTRRKMLGGSMHVMTTGRTRAIRRLKTVRFANPTKLTSGGKSRRKNFAKGTKSKSIVISRLLFLAVLLGSLSLAGTTQAQCSANACYQSYRSTGPVARIIQRRPLRTLIRQRPIRSLFQRGAANRPYLFRARARCR